ncbi:PEP-CTERM sorting domain-containing protein [Allorhodopirellula solitaria]|uniref:Uncharacterized protein n=1 Tax=Allorhodopirellula solitaria TaxID=2527987 RepID=A0A5C5WX89_9BACT|nr:PEP-CTERM sorting domain-containing protein [Allorhodopirellula solitaria]TWT55336.1 hypothetical protein CA85_49630 [Allorhodopirellula solitaria]
MLCFTKTYLSCLLRPERVAVLFAATVLATPSTDAGTLIYDQEVTENVIVGSGIGNGGFTVDRDNGVELGLRGKVRYNASGDPENTFNSNGDGTYTFQAGGYGSSTRAKWNFDWSINSDMAGTSGVKLDDLTYLLEMDFDPASTTNFLSFDPINVSFADHGIGDNLTGKSNGDKATDATSYSQLIGTKNLAQNSWNLDFFDDPTHPFNANVPGTFDIRLTAFDGTTQVAQAAIQINTVPEPASILAFVGIGVCAVATQRRRKSRRVTQA